MATEEKHKSFVISLIAVFCGITFFSASMAFNLTGNSFGYSMSSDHDGKRVSQINNETDEGHVDDIKNADEQVLVGSSNFPNVSSTASVSDSVSQLNATTSDSVADKTQYVLMAFDGSKSIHSWESILNFANEMKDIGSPVHFTFFINAVYFLTNGTKDSYISPTGKVGDSAIGYSDSDSEISDRIVEINRALREGHEIGSHSAGHNDGSKWTVAEWESEFQSFNEIMSNIEKLNPALKLKENLQLNIGDFVGFRAPNLGVNDNLYIVLKDHHFLYDSSQIAKPFSFPFKDADGLWHIPLGVVKTKQKTNILAMDYNWWFRQTGAKDLLKKGTKEWEEDKDEVVNAYKDYFDSHYNGNKSPLSIGHHFSLWNDGLYWEALKDFAKYACTKPNVKCVSHKEYIEAMVADQK